MQELSTIIANNGLAIALVAIFTWFLIFKFWPWYTSRQAAKDADEKKRLAEKDLEEKRRHDTYMSTIDRFTDAVNRSTDAVNALNTNTHGMSQMIASMVDKIDDHHIEVMGALGKSK